jgi:Fe-S cluster assembly protein SufB
MDAITDRPKEYKYGFVTDVDTEKFPPGLNEEIVRAISARKNEPDFLLEFRLNAYTWRKEQEPPRWAHVEFPPIDFQDIHYYAAPKSMKDAPQSLDEVDPELLRTFDRLWVPLHDREHLAGVAVDAVFDSVSVGTTPTSYRGSSCGSGREPSCGSPR